MLTPPGDLSKNGWTFFWTPLTCFHMLVSTLFCMYSYKQETLPYKLCNSQSNRQCLQCIHSIHARTHAHTHTHTHTYACTHTHTPHARTRAHRHTCTHACTHAHMHTRTHAHTHTTHTHTDMHTVAMFCNHSI